MSVADFYELFDRHQPEAPEADNVVPINGTSGNRYAQAALRSEAGAVASAPHGERNDTLNRAWYNMGRHIGAGSIDTDTVKDTLTDAAKQCGLPDDEIERTLRDDDTSGLKKGSAKPRVPDPQNEAPSVTIIEPPDEGDLDAFWESREILAHLHAFARARCVGPWAVLGNALARVICATHPAVSIPPIVGGAASLNLFVGIVGKSGSGKGAAESVAAEAVDVGHIATRNTGSGEGAVHAYMKRVKGGDLEMHTQAVLFSIPEIDSLGAVGARQGSTLMPLLRSGWSGEQLGFQYADPQKNLLVPAHEYRMCIVAGIQPGRAGTLLDDEDGGTPQRFLWLPATDPDAPEELPEAPEPITIDLREPVVTTARNLSPISVCQQARDTIVRERQKANRGEHSDLDGHALLTRLKVAAGLALLEERREVTDDDWELSGVIARMSDATRSRVIAHRQAEVAKANAARALAEAERQVVVTETVTDAAVKRVAKGVLRRLKNDGEQTYSVARRQLASRDRDHFDEALDRLKSTGQIGVTETEHGQVLQHHEETS